MTYHRHAGLCEPRRGSEDPYLCRRGLQPFFVLKYPVPCWAGSLRMRWSFIPSIVPSRDQTVYLVLNDFGRLGRAYCEASEDRSDLETTISDLISGQYDNPVRVIAFNTAERWSEDVSEDIAREIVRRLGLAGDELPSSPWGIHRPAPRRGSSALIAAGVDRGAAMIFDLPG
jgi:hypothetical protein